MDASVEIIAARMTYYTSSSFQQGSTSKCKTLTLRSLSDRLPTSFPLSTTAADDVSFWIMASIADSNVLPGATVMKLVSTTFSSSICTGAQH